MSYLQDASEVNEIDLEQIRNKAVGDEYRKKITLLLRVLNCLEETVQNSDKATLSTMDQLPLSQIEETVRHCMMAGMWEDAMIGLAYLTYQARVEKTNVFVDPSKEKESD